MSHVLVAVDFPVGGEQRKKIYDCLTQKRWGKYTEPGRDVDTVWSVSFHRGSQKKMLSGLPIMTFKIAADLIVSQSLLFSGDQMLQKNEA